MWYVNCGLVGLSYYGLVGLSYYGLVGLSYYGSRKENPHSGCHGVTALQAETNR